VTNRFAYRKDREMSYKYTMPRVSDVATFVRSKVLPSRAELVEWPDDIEQALALAQITLVSTTYNAFVISLQMPGRPKQYFEIRIGEVRTTTGVALEIAEYEAHEEQAARDLHE
jgi:hypothetical protein